ncbi:hypothetical protein AGMMS50230_20850 [Spirochaetia bacterium]|nr:hypothetical protein AGMMS50230_20850 [Spirochaetia bacterium]
MDKSSIWDNHNHGSVGEFLLESMAENANMSVVSAYFGTDYKNTLPTLVERNAIFIGKGLKLKQPVILELNNRDYLFTPYNGANS